VDQTEAGKFGKEASSGWFMLRTRFNSGISSFNKDIKKCQWVVGFYFLGELDLAMDIVYILEENVNGGKQSWVWKSSKTVIDKTTKVWTVGQECEVNCLVNDIIHDYICHKHSNRTAHSKAIRLLVKFVVELKCDILRGPVKWFFESVAVKTIPITKAASENRVEDKVCGKCGRDIGE